MNSKRAYYMMIATLVILFAAILGGAYLANQQLQKQADKLTKFKTHDQVLTEEQIGLNKAKSDIEKYSSLERIAKVVVPQDKDQAKAVREIVNMATIADIKLTGINFPASTLGGPAGGAATGLTQGTATVTPATPTAPSAATQALSQLTPVKGINGVYRLPITIELDSSTPVPYTKFITFLKELELNRRTAQVTGIVLQPSPLDRNMVSFTLTVDEFIKP